MVYMDARKFEKAIRTAERARMIWQGLEDAPKEAVAMQHMSQAYVSQAYKKQSDGKAGSTVTGLIEKARKSVKDGIEIAKGCGERNGVPHILHCQPDACPRRRRNR